MHLLQQLGRGGWGGQPRREVGWGAPGSHLHRPLRCGYREASFRGIQGTENQEGIAAGDSAGWGHRDALSLEKLENRGARESGGERWWLCGLGAPCGAAL